MTQTPIRRGLVVGCGGTLGFAWTAASLLAVEEALGWDARDADVLVGTSAGAEVVAALGAGRSAADLVAALDGAADADPVLAGHLAIHPGAVPPLPAPSLPALGLALAGLRRETGLYSGLAGLLPRGRGDATFLREYGDALAGTCGWVEHPATWIVGTDTSTGRRVPFGHPDAPPAGLGAAVAASWAIPGWFPPVEIQGRGYLDGGAVSPTSADLLLGAGLEEVVVIAPMTSAEPVPAKGLARVERLLRGQMTRRLDREVAALRQAGVRVVRIEPGPHDLTTMGANFMDLSRREATLRTARHTAPRRVREAIAAAHSTEGVTA